ncbi:hypothetical protein BDZ89DRAFT_1067926 [Hymenopellis radicata]|nr:hypothetical protein BDZ89DRAFT_1067926 [Hymenopellis radicata]
MKEILPDGHYVIVNSRQRNVAALAEPRERSSLMARTYSSSNEKTLTKNLIWSINGADNGRYKFQNTEFGSLAYAGHGTKAGDDVKGHNREQYWELQVARADPPRYRISSTDSELFWHLQDGELDTPVKLVDKANDERSWWELKRIDSAKASNAPLSIKQTEENPLQQMISTPPARDPMQMITPEGHAWTGCYQYRMPGAQIDPPMFFTLARIPSNGYGPLQFSARGVDAVGAFNILGSIYTSGMVEAKKMYDHGLTWNWVGTMTPNGMAGTWGQNGEFQGWWWIWPKDGA